MIDLNILVQLIPYKVGMEIKTDSLPKNEINLLTLMSFLTCIYLILLWNKKEDILKNLDFHSDFVRNLEVNGT